MKAERLRSWLFVPADSDRKLAKGLGSPADVLILDLEDAVALERKGAAREAAAEFVKAHAAARQKLYVRVNPLDTDLTLADLAAVVVPGLDGIMLPKVRGGLDVQRVAHCIDALEARANIAAGTVRIVPVATETAQAMLTAHTFIDHPARVAGFTWGGEDLSAAIGASSKTDEDGKLSPLYAHAESVCLLIASAIGAAAIDTVFIDFRDDAGLRAACARSRRRGFSGRIAIHPDQVGGINAGYAPTEQELLAAQRVVDAFAAAPGTGTVGIDGVMYDRPHLVQAMAVIRNAS